MQRARLRDVAERAGCSVSAVSLVVNGRDEGRIAPELRARILDAVDALNYRPNGSARDLATRSPSTVALVCPDVRNPFFGELLYGVQAALEGRFGIDLVVGSGGSDYSARTVRDAQSANIAGLILANPAAEVMDGFVATCPTVLIDAPDSAHELVRVDLDVDDAGRQLADHLATLGHRRVGYLDLGRGKQTFVRRRASLASGLARRGGELIDTAPATDVTVRAGARAFLDGWPGWEASGVTAVVCADDVLAYGALLGARSLGIEIPGRLSVAGFNDIAYSELVAPALTTVRFDALELGRRAGELLLAEIDGVPSESVVLPSALVVRESTTTALEA